MDTTTVAAIAQYVGLVGAAFAGGLTGGKKALKGLQDAVAELQADVILIKRHLGMVINPRPGNGKAAQLGRSEHSNVVESSERAERSGG